MGYFAQRGDADDQRPIVSIRVAAGDRDVKLFGQRQQSLVERLRQLERRPLADACPRQGKRHKNGHRLRRHRRQVAQIHRKRLAADPLRHVTFQLKIDTVGQQIGRHDEIGWRGTLDHRGIVGKSEGGICVCRYVLAEPAVEFGFHASIVRQAGSREQGVQEKENATRSKY